MKTCESVWCQCPEIELTLAMLPGAITCLNKQCMGKKLKLKTCLLTGWLAEKSSSSKKNVTTAKDMWDLQLKATNEFSLRIMRLKGSYVSPTHPY